MRSQAVWELASFAQGIDIDAIPSQVAESLEMYLTDSFSVGVAGMRTPEMRDLVSVWPPSDGPCALFGTDTTVSLEQAIMLNGSALCVLELDEGNKFARGHPGAHVLPAALAEMQRIGSNGADFMTAVLAGYEVAARIARAFSPRPGLHPHGHWGAIGAAVAVGRLNGFTRDQLAQVIDAAAGLPLATPFASALAGSFVRNAWIPSAGLNGVTAARIVQAGLGSVDDTGTSTYGELLGTIDEREVIRGLGDRWEITGGYFKRHSSCNYTHPPADAALELKFSGEFNIEEIADIRVHTHALAIPLDERHPRTRLAAMFSIPHVVAVALVTGSCRPIDFSPDRLDAPEIVRLRNLVSVELYSIIDGRRPAERGARVDVSTASDIEHSAFLPNSVGDADYQPFTLEQIIDKSRALIGPMTAQKIVTEVAGLRSRHCPR